VSAAAESAAWVPVAVATTIPPGDEDVCTHDGGGLAGGAVEGDQVICPRHGARFCLRTGRALSAPAYEPVRSYMTRVSDGVVEVRTG
jgi:3-phenylpropionate/trans-cinnamate dioxygenase ferredoxin component